MARRDGETAVLERAEAGEGKSAAMAPKVIFPLGRGSRGKTVFTRWVADRALNAGREVMLADADRTNQTLSGFFEGVVSPVTADDADMRPWLDALLEKAITERRSLIVDFGGGDLLLKSLALELPVAEFLTQQGVHPVAMHFVGADKDDISYLESMEEGGLFAPERTAIVLNAGALPAGVSERAAFDKHVAHPAVRKAIGRGVQFVVMPKLVCMQKVDDARMRFTAPRPGTLGLLDAQRVVSWLKLMEENFTPLRDWLP